MSEEINQAVEAAAAEVAALAVTKTSDLAKVYSELKAEKAELEKQVKGINKSIAIAEGLLIDKMLEDGTVSIRLPEVGLFTITTGDYPKITNDEKFATYLESIGQANLGKYSVHHKMLTSWWQNFEATDDQPKPDAETIGLEVFSKQQISLRREK